MKDHYNIRKVNKKYVNLLSKTFDKYKYIDILARKGDEEEEKREETTAAVGLYTSTKYYVRLKAGASSKPSPGEKSEKKRGYTFHKLYKIKQFTHNEDEMIVKTMQSAEKKSAGILELTKVLNRPYKSIQHRIEKLSTGSGRRRFRPFSLQEDYLIIDNALKSLKLCKSLEETHLHDYEDLAMSLDRQAKSVFERWNTQLKMWLLQYYQKTLNLEIRPMLINVLADNFDSIQSIDWDWVKRLPEFSGYTSNGLKRVFFTKIIHHIARQLEVERTEMTLDKLSEAAKDFKFSNVNKSVIARQKQIVDYFELHVKLDKVDFDEFSL